MLRGFYALERTRTVFCVQCVIATANVVLALCSSAATDAGVTAPGLALAYGGAYAVGRGHLLPRAAPGARRAGDPAAGPLRGPHAARGRARRRRRRAGGPRGVAVRRGRRRRVQAAVAAARSAASAWSTSWCSAPGPGCCGSREVSEVISLVTSRLRADRAAGVTLRPTMGGRPGHGGTREERDGRSQGGQDAWGPGSVRRRPLPARGPARRAARRPLLAGHRPDARPQRRHPRDLRPGPRAPTPCSPPPAPPPPSASRTCCGCSTPSQEDDVVLRRPRVGLRASRWTAWSPRSRSTRAAPPGWSARWPRRSPPPTPRASRTAGCCPRTSWSTDSGSVKLIGFVVDAVLSRPRRARTPAGVRSATTRTTCEPRRRCSTPRWSAAGRASRLRRARRPLDHGQVLPAPPGPRRGAPRARHAVRRCSARTPAAERRGDDHRRAIAEALSRYLGERPRSPATDAASRSAARPPALRRADEPARPTADARRPPATDPPPEATRRPDRRPAPDPEADARRPAVAGPAPTRGRAGGPRRRRPDEATPGGAAGRRPRRAAAAAAPSDAAGHAAARAPSRPPRGPTGRRAAGAAPPPRPRGADWPPDRAGTGPDDRPSRCPTTSRRRRRGPRAQLDAARRAGRGSCLVVADRAGRRVQPRRAGDLVPGGETDDDPTPSVRRARPAAAGHDRRGIADFDPERRPPEENPDLRAAGRRRRPGDRLGDRDLLRRPGPGRPTSPAWGCCSTSARRPRSPTSRRRCPAAGYSVELLAAPEGAGAPTAADGLDRSRRETGVGGRVVLTPTTSRHRPATSWSG